jgi:hypothetical protein
LCGTVGRKFWALLEAGWRKTAVPCRRIFFYGKGLPNYTQKADRGAVGAAVEGEGGEMPEYGSFDEGDRYAMFL